MHGVPGRWALGTVARRDSRIKRQGSVVRSMRELRTGAAHKKNIGVQGKHG